MTLRTFQEIWGSDKQLLHRQHPDLPINWKGTLPCEEDLCQILLAAGSAITSGEHITSADCLVSATIKRLRAEVCEIWGGELGELAIEILDPGMYLTEVENLRKEVSEKQGRTPPEEPPGAAYVSPPQKRLVVCKQYLALEARDGKTPELKPFPWTKPWLEKTLCEGIAVVLYRQNRGEWGEDFEGCMSALEPGYAASTNALEEVLAHYMTEMVTRNGHQDWTLAVMQDKVRLWSPPCYSLQVYRAVDSLMTTQQPRQIAMIDRMQIVGNHVVPILNTNHPSHKQKVQIFEAAGASEAEV